MKKLFYLGPDGLVLPSLAADPASPEPGEIYFNTVDGKIKFYTGSGFEAGANAALSNLAALAINTDLLPDGDNTHDLGSATFHWDMAFIQAISADSANFNFQNDGGHIDLTIDDASSLRLFSVGGTTAIPIEFWDAAINERVKLSAPAALSASYDLKLPLDGGLTGQVLSTDGSGNLFWSSAGGSAHSDAVFRIQDDGDNTKELAFEVAAITTGTTRTWTVPDANLNFSLTTSGSFATNTLNNLGTTAINADLLPSGSRSLGASGTTWTILHAQNGNFRTSGGGDCLTLHCSGDQTTPSGATSFPTIKVAGADLLDKTFGIYTEGYSNSSQTKHINIETGNNSNAGASAITGDIRYRTGNTSGGGASGSHRFTTGTSATGVRGGIIMDAPYIDFPSRATAPATATGRKYYNTTDNTPYVYDGAAWVPLTTRNYSASSSTLTSTGSATYVDLDSMTVTPTAGSYMVQFSCSHSNSNNGDDRTRFIVTVGGVDVADSERRTGFGAASYTTASTHAIVTVNGSQAIVIRYRAPSGGTSTVLSRTLTAVRVG